MHTRPNPIDFARFTHLSFDCYGTLIDWETGILRALAPLLARHRLHATAPALLRIYSRLEAQFEHGPYRPYRTILRQVLAGLVDELSARWRGTPDEAAPSPCGLRRAGPTVGIFTSRPAALGTLARSLPRWQPFSDTVPALHRLSRRFRLVLLSNIDDDLLTATVRRLGVPFQAAITAAQVHAYKPDPAHFRTALNVLRIPPERLLHVAQSLYHDHVPAKQLGLSTVWVNRRSRLPGTGVALPARARPDLIVPDLGTLARIALGR